MGWLEVKPRAGNGSTAGPGRAGLPLHAEIGVRTCSGDVRFRLGLRQRFYGLIGTGFPPWDMLNSAQLVLQVGISP